MLSGSEGVLQYWFSSCGSSFSLSKAESFTDAFWENESWEFLSKIFWYSWEGKVRVRHRHNMYCHILENSKTLTATVNEMSYIQSTYSTVWMIEMCSRSFGKSKILTFSSMSVIWSSMKATSLEKTGRSRGSRAQHLHITLYLEKVRRWISRRENERGRERERDRKSVV